MENNELSPEEYIEIADKVHSGEYFRDAHQMVDIDIHDPMAERYLYLTITAIAIMIASVAVIAWSGFYPLKPKIPFIFSTNDLIDDVPRLIPLTAYHGENPNVALRRFLVQNYVKTREEYDAAIFDRAHNAIESLSTPQVLNEYDNFISQQNPESPISLYQRKTKRIINVTGSQSIGNKNKGDVLEYQMVVYYEATLKTGENSDPPTKHEVNIAFQYKDIKLDEKTGKITPYGFIVTEYRSKNL